MIIRVGTYRKIRPNTVFRRYNYDLLCLADCFGNTVKYRLSDLRQIRTEWNESMERMLK